MDHDILDRLELRHSLRPSDRGDEILRFSGYIDCALVVEAVFLLNRSTRFLQVSEVGVDRNYRRRGICTLVYCKAEELTGLTLLMGDDVSEEAEALWLQKDRPFGRNL
jgi:ribosomal protein S18 acetylase RimI-like enzyme